MQCHKGTKVCGVLALLFSLLLTTNLWAKESAKPSGKVYFTQENIKGYSPDALARFFEKQPTKGKITRAKNSRWTCTLVAFFKKESVPGPITIWIYDKEDKEAIKAKEPIHAISVDAPPKTIFLHELELDPDVGFNKDRSYLVMIGQIIQKKEKIYASGEMILQK